MKLEIRNLEFREGKRWVFVDIAQRLSPSPDNLAEPCYSIISPAFMTRSDAESWLANKYVGKVKNDNMGDA